MTHKKTNSVKAVRSRKRTPKYPCRLSVMVTKEQFAYLTELGLLIDAPSEFGAPCRGIRALIDEAMECSNEYTGK